MSAGYRAVLWTAHKKLYDRVLLAGVAGYLVLFVAVGLLTHDGATFEAQLIRALGTCALLLLHVVLSIGPLARFDRRFLPLLYNRRHLGVTLFVVALAHGVFATVQYHALGNRNPLVSLLVSNPRYDSLAQFPFEVLGVAALLILFLMAATSHDFWLHNLSAPVWKSLHMLVYLAYTLLVLHVGLGVLQSETRPALAVVLGAGVAWIVGLHVVAAWRERAADRPLTERRLPGDDSFVRVCRVAEIPEDRAVIATLSGERVAVFRYQGRVSAISNVCQHQNGPLGEGKIVDGCITCPWHGYQYRPDDGASPPPFTEKVPTFNVRVEGGEVWVDPRPHPPGTRVEPARIDDSEPRPGGRNPDELYVGYLADAPPGVRRFTRRTVAVLATLTVTLAIALPSLQGPFDRGVFEFGKRRELEGVLEERPYPMLRDVVPSAVPSDASRDAPSDPAPEPPPRELLLVATGKHGAADVAGRDGQRVRVAGSLISRPELGMLELAGDLDPLGEDHAAHPPIRELGEITLRGEIVDTKCFLGVMKPGRGKPHRSCAARCIAGGIPPALLAESPSGEILLALLVDADDRPLGDQVLPWVGEPIAAVGVLVERGGIRYLRTSIDAFEREGSPAPPGHPSATLNR